MKEVDIVKAIMKYLKTVPGCFCWKEHGGMYGTAGIPDIIACINGHFYGFEVKTENGKPTRRRIYPTARFRCHVNWAKCWSSAKPNCDQNTGMSP